MLQYFLLKNNAKVWSVIFLDKRPSGPALLKKQGELGLSIFEVCTIP
jgi:hypothetical protein